MKITINSSIFFPKIKLNTNCKEEEKTGTGPGSCGGNKLEFNKNIPLASRSDTMSENDWDTIGLINHGNIGGYGKDSLRSYLTDPNNYNGLNKEEYANQVAVADRLLKESKLLKDLTVYRGVVSSYFDELQEGDIFFDPSFIHVTPVLEEAQSYADDRKKSIDKYFSEGKNINRTIIQLHIPKGTSAIDLQNLRIIDSPALLLDRNIKMKVESINNISKIKDDIFKGKQETNYKLIKVSVQK